MMQTYKDGFRMRGNEMTRLETFTDAAFAFAVTLLVISIDRVPASYAELLGALREGPAFALSFLLLMTFWWGHWEWSRRYGLEDGRSIILSAALVLTVMVYVYPLKYLMSLMMSWVSGGAISPSARLQSLDELYGIFAVYGIGFFAMSLTLVLLNLHAWTLRDELELTELERFDTRAVIATWSVLGIVGLGSSVVAVATPPNALALPGWVYMLLAVLMPALGVFTGRRRRRRFGTPGSARE